MVVAQKKSWFLSCLGDLTSAVCMEGQLWGRLSGSEKVPIRSACFARHMQTALSKLGKMRCEYIKIRLTQYEKEGCNKWNKLSQRGLDSGEQVVKTSPSRIMVKWGG